MAWEDRGGIAYYYRSICRDGRTVKQYVGRGPVAELAARLDARARRERERAHRLLRAERDRCGPAERAAEEFEAACDRAVSAAFHGAGFHRHRSGPWRKKRDGPDAIVD